MEKRKIFKEGEKVKLIEEKDLISKGYKKIDIKKIDIPIEDVELEDIPFYYYKKKLEDGVDYLVTGDIIDFLGKEVVIDREFSPNPFVIFYKIRENNNLVFNEDLFCM